jgi:hypothetical protein
LRGCEFRTPEEVFSVEEDYVAMDCVRFGILEGADFEAFSITEDGCDFKRRGYVFQKRRQRI